MTKSLKDKASSRVIISRYAFADTDEPASAASPPAPVRDPRPVDLNEHPVSINSQYSDTPQGPPTDPSDNPFEAFVKKYKNDPVAFVREVLKAQPLPWQIEFLEKIAGGSRRISIRAGHGVGKSTGVSWALLWHATTRYPQKSICTAPTAGQLFDALFAELKRWINVLPEWLRVLYEVQSERIILQSSPEASFIAARTASPDRPEALAGIHSEHVLLVADEASAVPEPVFESAAGSMSGHSATTILIGNPTRNSGLFFKSHHELRATYKNEIGKWEAMHVSCLNNPLVSQDFVEQIKATYGEESNAFRVRVLGEFALRDDDVLIPADLVDAAMVRDIRADPEAPLVYGLDVARFGDDRSVLCKRRGNVVEEFKTWRGLDLMQLTGAVVAEARHDNPTEILVDSIGLGAGVADRLRELYFNVRDVNVSETAATNPSASRLRDDLWLSIRDWLRQRACRLPKDAELRQELVSPTYTFTSSGKIVVEGKASMKKRGLRSPDLADSLGLTFASIHAAIGGRASRWVTGQPLKRNIRGVR